MLMQIQNLQKCIRETNTQENIITQIYLAKNRHMINGLVDTLKHIYNTSYNNNLAIIILT